MSNACPPLASPKAKAGGSNFGHLVIGYWDFQPKADPPLAEIKN